MRVQLWEEGLTARQHDHTSGLGPRRSYRIEREARDSDGRPYWAHVDVVSQHHEPARQMNESELMFEAIDLIGELRLRIAELEAAAKGEGSSVADMIERHGLRMPTDAERKVRMDRETGKRVAEEPAE